MPRGTWTPRPRPPGKIMEGHAVMQTDEHATRSTPTAQPTAQLSSTQEVPAPGPVAASPVGGFRVPFAHLGQGRSGRVISIIRNQTALVLLFVLVIAGGLLSDVFLTPKNLLNILWAVSVLGIIALGQTMLLITCNFDMSVAYVVGFAGIITVTAQIWGFDLFTSMAFGMLGGVLVGIFNGALVVITGAKPFLIKLGSRSRANAIPLTRPESTPI